MKLKDTRTLQERAEDLARVLTWLIMDTLKNSYKSVDEFKRTYAKIKNHTADSNTAVKFHSQFKKTNLEYRKIIGYSYDPEYIAKCIGTSKHKTKAPKRIFVRIDDILNEFKTLNINYLVYQKHFNMNRKKVDANGNRSYSTYKVHSFWYLTYDFIAKHWNDESIIKWSEGYYTERQIKFINNILRSNKMRTEIAKQKAQWDKEYAEGKHMLTWEENAKEEKRKQKTADKHRMAIAKKAAKETLTDYAKLQLENEQLKAEIEHLKSLVNENADIPRETPAIEPPAQEIIEVQEIQEPVVEKMENPNDGIPGEDPEDKRIVTFQKNLVHTLKTFVLTSQLSWKMANEIAEKAKIEYRFNNSSIVDGKRGNGFSAQDVPNAEKVKQMLLKKIDDVMYQNVEEITSISSENEDDEQ